MQSGNFISLKEQTLLKLEIQNFGCWSHTNIRETFYKECSEKKYEIG
jgi:hypothetical protein